MSNFFSSLGYVASGDVYPSRFVSQVQQVPAQFPANYQVAQQSAAGQAIVGISHEGTRYPQGLSWSTGQCAIDLQPFVVYGDNQECLLELAGTVNPGQYIKATTDGKGIVGTPGTDNIGARAIERGTSGCKIRVKVTCQPEGAVS